VTTVSLEPPQASSLTDLASASVTSLEISMSNTRGGGVFAGTTSAVPTTTGLGAVIYGIQNGGLSVYEGVWMKVLGGLVGVGVLMVW
jgi:hypothetical protein